MRILFVSTNLPIPPNNGQSIRSLSIIQALASIGHELSFISFANRGSTEPLYPLSSYCSEIHLMDRELTNMSEQSDYFRRAGCLLSLKPYSLERFRSKPMQLKIQKLLRDKHFDLVVCDGLYSMINIRELD